MDVSELRKINRLENATIKEGQALRVKADSNENPNQGTSLIDAIEQVQDSAPKLEQFPDLKVLTAPKATTVPAAAVVTVYKDKSTGVSYKRVEETGRVGTIQDFATDQTRFYAFHRYLPTGSYIRVDYPQKGQSILVEVINQLPEKDPYTVRLSAKCMDYLMIREAGAEVRLRYVIPFGE
jgi:LysM repeat protein